MNSYAMNEKPARHARIRDLLSRTRIHSQEELQRLLRAQGVNATQATLSRDLRELGVLKGPEGYRLSEGGTGHNPVDDRELQRALMAYMRGGNQAGNLVVLRTGPGHAQALALELDKSRLPETLGTVAGDDTIFVATGSGRQAARLLSRLSKLTGGR
jgi:transcriptional regulator of arginine metabolism